MSIPVVKKSPNIAKNQVIVTTVDNLSFSDWLTTQLQEKGMSQADLARKSGVTRQAINNYVNGMRQSPDMNSVKKIARALGVPVEEVLRITNILPPTTIPPELERLRFILGLLPPDRQEDLVNYAEYLYQQQERQEREGKIGKRLENPK